MSCSLIIPAYNEAGRIRSIVTAGLACELFAEVVVVDDGSQDGTADEARAQGARVVRHPRNQGKARAMETGLAATAGEVVTFLDSDLTGVSVDHVAQLVKPVVEGQCRAALAVFRGGRLATTLAQTFFPMISGQRCLQRELLADFDGWDTRFGIETAINDHLRRKGVRQQIVEWHGAAQVMKEEKRGFWAGLGSRLRMYWEILRAWLSAKLKRR